MSKHERNWRPTLLSLDDIRYDLRVGSTKFGEWMARGWMPRPRIKTGGVTRWLAADLDAAIADFPDRAALAEEQSRQGATTARANPWRNQRAS